MPKGFTTFTAILVAALVAGAVSFLSLQFGQEYESDLSFGAPTSTSQRSVIPTTDDLYFVGSTSPARRFSGIYVGTASSTFLGNVGVGTTTAGTVFSLQGVGNFQPGTSTLFSGIVTSSITATSGITLTGGCFKIPDGTCLAAGGSGTITGGGGINQLSYFTGLSAIAGTSTPTAAIFIATSSTAASSFPIASTTLLSVFDRITVGGAGTSTFTGGVSTAGLSSSQGLTVSAGDLLLTGVVKQLVISTSTYVGGISISTNGGLSTVSGITITGGQLQATGIKGIFGPLSWTFGSSTDSLSTGNLLSVAGTGTSTFTGAISALRINHTQATSSVTVATSTPSAISAVEVKGDIFYAGQSYGEWVPLTMTAMQTYIDCSLGNKFTGTLSIANTVIRVKNCKSGHSAILRLVQDSTGGRTIGWSTSSPVILNPNYASTTAGAVQWFAGIMQGNFFTLLAATSSVSSCGIGC